MEAIYYCLEISARTWAGNEKFAPAPGGRYGRKFLGASGTLTDSVVLYGMGLDVLFCFETISLNTGDEVTVIWT